MLKDGKWQGESYDKGAASRPEIMLLAGTYLAGDLTETAVTTLLSCRLRVAGLYFLSGSRMRP